MTPKQARDRVRWFQKAFSMQDWKIPLFIRDNPPKWAEAASVQLGACQPDVPYKIAKVWVSLSRCKAYNESGEETLFHELAHVLCSDVGIRGDQQLCREFLWNRLGAVCEKAYKYDGRRKTK